VSSLNMMNGAMEVVCHIKCDKFWCHCDALLSCPCTFVSHYVLTFELLIGCMPSFSSGVGSWYYNIIVFHRVGILMTPWAQKIVVCLVDCNNYSITNIRFYKISWLAWIAFLVCKVLSDNCDCMNHNSQGGSFYRRSQCKIDYPRCAC